MKIVINRCFGGFGLSNEAILRYAELKNINIVECKNKIHAYDKVYYIDGIEDNAHYFSYYSISRDDQTLVQVVEELGSEKSSGDYAKLTVVEIPDDVVYEIQDYDGRETIHEVHRSW